MYEKQELENLKNYLIQLAKEQLQYTVKGQKNDGLYMVCCTIALVRLAEITNYGKEEYKFFYTCHHAAEHYYDKFIEEGDIKII